MCIRYVQRSFTAVRIVLMVKSESKQKDQWRRCVWPWCRRLRHRRVPVTTGWHRLVPVTTGWHRRVPVTTGWHRRVPVTTGWHRRVPVTTGWHRHVPMTTGWHNVPARHNVWLLRHLDTVQYFNQIRSHWIFILNSIYSIHIWNFEDIWFDIRFKWHSRIIPSLVDTPNSFMNLVYYYEFLHRILINSLIIAWLITQWLPLVTQC